MYNETSEITNEICCKVIGIKEFVLVIGVNLSGIHSKSETKVVSMQTQQLLQISFQINKIRYLHFTASIAV